VIRPATSADADQIIAIWNPEIRDTLVTFNAVEKTPDMIRDLVVAKSKAGHAFLVAETAGCIVGFALYGPFRAGVGYAHTVEHTIVLGDGARGQGIGVQLMAAITQHAKAAGMHSMWAGVSSGNPDAVGFHARLGFEYVATLPEVGRKFDQWYDLVLMQKRL